MAVPSDHISVTHGSLTVNVPRDLFSGPECLPIAEKVERFRKMISERYPWITENSLDVLMRNARKEMLRITDDESNGKTVSRHLASEGKMDNAIKHLEKYLERDPNDADSWYTYGELLCKVGRVEEGYRAMNRGRSLIEK